MFAINKGHTEAAKLLLENGADVSAQNDQNKTALDIAKENGHHDLISLIESFMAQQNLEILISGAKNNTAAQINF